MLLGSTGQCKSKVFSSISSLRIHYSVHYRTTLERKYVDKITGNKCFECQNVYNDKLKLVAHIGSHHRKGDIFLKTKGIYLEQRRHEFEKLPNINHSVSVHKMINAY